MGESALPGSHWLERDDTKLSGVGRAGQIVIGSKFERFLISIYPLVFAIRSRVQSSYGPEDREGLDRFAISNLSEEGK